ncbi:hypothetical protein M8J77_011882 [Diaphorina citri]|nr:hypothetical protein M8J77_011882 [Diaphorina citri]
MPLDCVFPVLYDLYCFLVCVHQVLVCTCGLEFWADVCHGLDGATFWWLVLKGFSTPCGTGPLKVGDVVEAGLGHKDLVKVKFHVKEPEIPEENSENTEERLMTFPDFPTRTFPDFPY